MKKLRPLGFWQEFWSLEFSAGTLAEARIHAHKRKFSNKDLVMQYLEGGQVLLAVPGIVFCPESGEYLGVKSIHTDGTWIWPEYLATCVSRYGNVLPKDFVTHVETVRVPQNEVSVDFKQLPWTMIVIAPGSDDAE